MIYQIIINIHQDLTGILPDQQLKTLLKVLNKHLSVLNTEKCNENRTRQNMLPLFLAAKRVEGCSEKSLRYYESVSYTHLAAI